MARCISRNMRFRISLAYRVAVGINSRGNRVSVSWNALNHTLAVQTIARGPFFGVYRRKAGR